MFALNIIHAEAGRVSVITPGVLLFFFNYAIKDPLDSHARHSKMFQR